QHDDIWRPGDDDRLTSDSWRCKTSWCARGRSGKPSPRLQQAASRGRIHSGGSIRAADRRSVFADRILAGLPAIGGFLIHVRTPPNMRKDQTYSVVRAIEDLNVSAFQPLAILRQSYKINVA
ncbi:MAG: hypothetical protein WBE72_01355, partial [Terracidiphilus sp.]